MRTIFFSIFLLLFLSCQNTKRSEIINGLNSDKPAEIINACRLIGKDSDSSIVFMLLEHPFDARVSNDLRFKGISVYQAKMHAFERVSGLQPPNDVTYQLDSANVHFYVDWVREHYK